MKKNYSFYADDILIERLKKENPNFNLSKLIEMSVVYYLDNDNRNDTNSKLLFEMDNAKKEIQNLTFENRTLNELVNELKDSLAIQTKIMTKQSERLEEIFAYQNKVAQENYDSLLEQFRSFARINNNLNEKELYFLNYLMLPIYKDVTSYDEMPDYSLTSIYQSEKSLVAVNARIEEEMKKDKETRRNGKKF